MPISKHIVISDKEGALPFSKGLMASSLMATGLPPARAFHVAELIEGRLLEQGVSEITRRELTDLAERTLADEEGERTAQSYLRWQAITRLERPLVVLLGGATGVGKSTLATQLAARLGITRVIPTDAIREVMRSMLSSDLVPALHSSSFDADRVVRQPLPVRESDPLLVGFREQALAVAVGIRALARRAVLERTHLIVEGVHALPNALDREEFASSAVVVPLVVTVDDEDLHRSHFVSRAAEAGGRNVTRYFEYFAHIRRIQDYLRAIAAEHGTPIVASYSLDTTLAQVSELVVEQAARQIPLEEHESFDRGLALRETSTESVRR
ncbi:MAG: zeta toxin family protein [Actinobacteria bacterium]|nr:zeta toxin family protein [Actinomycetota bacterium]